MAVFNTRSLRNKTTQVLELLHDNDTDICCISETWLRKGDGAISQETRERGYTMFHNPRAGRGGGTAVLFKSDLRCTKQHNINYDSFEVTETLVKLGQQSFRICSIYRSPTQADLSLFLVEFEDFLTNLCSKPGKPIICGDFNFHLELSEDNQANSFRTLYTILGFNQHVTQSTHSQGGWLDIILTRDDVETHDVNVVQETGTSSDHYFVNFDLCVDSTQKNNVVWYRSVLRNLKDLDKNALKKDILNSELCKPDKYDNLDNAVNIFNDCLSRIINKHAPYVVKHRREDLAPWWSEDCQKGRRLRRRAERRYKKNKSPQNRSLYKQACSKASNIIDAVRNKYWKNKISQAAGDQKKLFSLVTRLLGTHSSVGKYPDRKTDADAANDLKDFFVEKVSRICEEIKSKQTSTSHTSPEQCSSTMSSFSLIGHDELLKIISEMPSKSCQLDSMPTWLLKECYHELSTILLYIVNESLSTGTFPASLKTALVVPILKKADSDPDELKNYRPISLLAFLSKVIEKSVHLQLTEYLNKNKLFSEYQSGYRQFHSCETALTKVHNDLLLGNDDPPHQALLILLDLSAAFDCLKHDILLETLNISYGLKEFVLKWMKSYLSNRSFKVVVNRTESGECFLTIGVPQGSILGPLLFILFTKHLEQIANKYGLSLHCYADDCQLYFFFKTLPGSATTSLHHLQLCLKEIKAWMTDNFLKLNEDKTEIIEIRPFYAQQKSVTNFDFDGQCLHTQKSAKSLGVYFDEKLNFERQVNETIKALNFRLKNMSRIGSKLDKDTKLTIVKSYILGKLDYCNVLYTGISQSSLNQLQNILNASLRFCYGFHSLDRSWRAPGTMQQLMYESHILPVNYRVLYKVALLCHKCINNIAPDYLSDLVKLKEPCSSHNLRTNVDKHLLQIKNKPHYKKMEYAFSHFGPTTWNSLPVNIRSIVNINIFKSELKTHYFKQAFHDI